MIFIFLLSFGLLYFIAYNKKSGIHQQYQFTVLLIAVSYVYLISNAVILNNEDWLLLYRYTIATFIFNLVMLVVIRSNILDCYMDRLKTLQKLESILNELTNNKKLIFLYAVLYAFSMYTQRWMSYEESIQYRLVTTGSEQVLGQIPSLLFLSATPFLLIMSIVRTRLYLFLPLIFISSIFMTISGNRSEIIITLFSIYYSLYRFQGLRIKKRYLIVSVLMSAVVIITIGHSRSGNSSLENIELFWRILSDFKIENYNILEIGEFYWPAHSIIRVMEELPTDILLMLKELSIFVPKLYWTGRPLPASESYMNILYNDLFITGHGYGFNNVAFGYWWGGYIGLLFYAFLCGCFFKAINNIILIYKVLGCFVFITFFFNIFHFARGVSIVGLIKNAIFLQMVPIFINIFIIYFVYKLIMTMLARISSRNLNGVIL